MVEELDLTDQDVSTIAEMIDSEISYHTPDWTQKELSGDHSGGEMPISDCFDSEVKDDGSPMTSESGPSSKSLALERLPSGRKYWSDSPTKGSDGNSPIKSAPSNLSTLVDLLTEGGSLTENDKSSGSNRKENDPNGAALLKLPEDICMHVDGFNKEKKPGSSTDLQARDRNDGADDLLPSNRPHLLGENRTMLCNNKPEDVKIIAEKLAKLLLKQQNELEELKRQHQSAIYDFFKELSPATRQKVLDTCKVKIPDYERQ